MSDILARICADKREHIAGCKAKIPEMELRELAAQQTPPRGFKKALGEKVASGKIALIAEIKKASPSKGLIRADFNAVEIAKSYAEAGAACLSVLTDIPYFQGSDEYLTAARAAVKIPVLRKDFMLDIYQVAETRALGADCILLIMAALSDAQAIELELAALDLEMDVLVEVHNREELERALTVNPDNAGKIIGVNNRDLKSLKIDLAISETLAKHIPEQFIRVCESGIANPADIARMRESGLHCFLIGEALMREHDITIATRNLLSL